MAAPAALLAKLALVAAQDKRAWKVAAIIVASALLPFVLAMVCIMNMAAAAAAHNNAALHLTFNSGHIFASMPAEYRAYITEMRSCFKALGTIITDIGSECEWDGELDVIRVKSVFYSLFFGSDFPRSYANHAFVDCFIDYETRTRPCEKESHHTDGEDCEEEYIVVIPIADLPTVYANVAALIGRPVAPEDMANISEIYYRVTHGDFSIDSGNVSLEGGANGTHDYIRELTAGDDSPPPTGGYISPIPGDWRELVTCEFGTGYAGHTGMDIGIPVGTSIRAVADGKVLFTRASRGGYGIHVAISHGGGIVTLYAHCSKLLVGEGQTVTQGQVIALSGNTGNSTGPHLHLEVIDHGVPKNPRGFLS